MREFNTRTTEGNYSITFETDDRKAFEQVQTLCRLLVDGKDGEIIPIEWIKEWGNRRTIQIRLTTKWIIEDWVKENETN